MAATATIHQEGVWPGGNGRRYAHGTITYDSDATVEAPVPFAAVEHVTFTKIGSGGDTGSLSIDETFTDGRYYIPDGAITVDAPSSNSDTYKYFAIGF